MSAKRDMLEYINGSMKEIDFLVDQYLSVETFDDFSIPMLNHLN